MELISLLKIDGATSPNAALINDGGAQYPVLLEALHTRDMFDLMKTSGYKYAGYPYDFKKDGQSILDLPLDDNYVIAPEVKQRMYYSLNVEKYTVEELKDMIDVDAMSGIDLPTNYTIHTREEFLRYLNDTSIVISDDDFLPLNYFVAPEARFTYEEYIDEANTVYVSQIESRMTHSYIRVKNLFNWMLESKLIPQECKTADVFKIYFAWGIPGMNVPVTGIKTENRRYILNNSQTVKPPIYQNMYGLIAGDGSMLTPIDYPDIPWKMYDNSPEAIASKTAGLAPDECTVVTYACKATQDVVLVETPIGTFEVNSSLGVFKNRIYPTIEVIAPHDTSSKMDITLFLPNNKEKLYKEFKLQALSSFLTAYRHDTRNVSTYKALINSAFSPITAVKAVALDSGLLLNPNRSTPINPIESDMRQIDESEFDRYFDGRLKEAVDEGNLPALKYEEVKEVIDSILWGSLNMDNVQHGKNIEMYNNNEIIYQALSAVNNSFGISVDMIYQEIRNIQPGQTQLTFTDGRSTLKVDIAPLTIGYRGYRIDLNEYRIKAAEEATSYARVVRVACELANRRGEYEKYTKENDEHVGIQFQIISKTNPDAVPLLDFIQKQYIETVNTEVVDATKRSGYLKMKHIYTAQKFFDALDTGKISFVADISSKVIDVPEDIRMRAANTTSMMVSSLPDFTSRANMLLNNKILHTIYCVNARVTYNHVIPYQGYTIPEVQLAAVWDNWGSNPAVFNQLVELGVLPPDHIPWSAYSLNDMLLSGDISSPTSLYTYMNKSMAVLQNWDPHVEFTHCPRFIESWLPGLVNSEDEDFEESNNEVSSSEAVVPMQLIPLGRMRMITQDDFKEYVFPEVSEKPTTYIKHFTGFEPDAIFTVPDIIDIIPADTGNKLAVFGDYIMVIATNERLHYTRVNELANGNYPVVHVYNRTWLLRDYRGNLHEVVV